MRERRSASKCGNGESEWLLALNQEARVPSIQAIQELKSLSFISRASDVTLRVRQALKRVRRQNASFVLSSYFSGVLPGASLGKLFLKYLLFYCRPTRLFTIIGGQRSSERNMHF